MHRQAGWWMRVPIGQPPPMTRLSSRSMSRTRSGSGPRPPTTLPGGGLQVDARGERISATYDPAGLQLGRRYSDDTRATFAYGGGRGTGDIAISLCATGSASAVEGSLNLP